MSLQPPDSNNIDLSKFFNPLSTFQKLAEEQYEKLNQGDIKKADWVQGFVAALEYVEEELKKIELLSGQGDQITDRQKNYWTMFFKKPQE